MKDLFKPDSGLMVFMAQVTDCIFLSMFFMLGCVPVVTAGASFAALYDSAARGLRRGEKNTWQRFWRAFATNWRAGIVPSILFLAALAGLACGMIRVWNAAVAGTVSWMLFAGIAFAAEVLVGMLSLLFPMLSRFENSLTALLKNTAVLALGNLPRTLALGIVNTVSLFLCVRFIVPLFFLPALAALLGSLFIEPIFRPFMPQEETEEAAG